MQVFTVYFQMQVKDNGEPAPTLLCSVKSCFNCMDGFVFKRLAFKDTLKFSYLANIPIILGYKMSSCAQKHRYILYSLNRTAIYSKLQSHLL